MFEKDLKQYLHFFSSKFFNILKYSSRIYVLPCVTIFPSNQCNYNCLMCLYRKSRTRDIETMEFSLIEKIVTECSKLKIKPLLHFSGQGEPLIYPEIREVMQICKEKRMKWSMTTNGYFLDQYAEDLVSNNCYAINVSIHGNALENDAITGVDSSFDKTSRSIKKLEEIKTQRKKKTPRIAINCVINEYNVTNLRSVLDAFLELPVNSIDFAHLHFKENDIKERDDSTNPAVIRKKNIQELIKFNSYIEETKFPINTFFYPKILKKDLVGYYTDKHHRFSSRVNESCIFPWLNVFVKPNGSVFCCSKDIGDLRTSSLNEIINSKRAVEFRERVRKGIEPKPPGCFRCPHKHYY
jgi:MoaA/NifB/PqqE/SkfB family radical SAM enzyme